MLGRARGAATGWLRDRGRRTRRCRRGRTRHAARREGRVVRVGRLPAGGNRDAPADAGAVVDARRALARVGERLLRGDLRPDSAVGVLCIARTGRDREPLLDACRRRVVRVQRAAGGAVSRVDEPEADVGLLQVAVAGAVDDAGELGSAPVGDRDVGPVGLLTGDVGVGLGDANARCARIRHGHHPERVRAAARAGHAGLAGGREGRGPGVAQEAAVVGGRVRPVQRAADEQERAAVSRRDVERIELQLGIAGVADLAAELIADRDVRERAAGGDVLERHRGVRSRREAK